MTKHDKIYIIEDDETILTLLHNHLSQSYDVKTVTNFRDIKQEVLAYQPDLILMDITLPFFNGFYWTTEIRKHLTIPIIFISSSNDEMDTVMALNMGGDDFVSKPFSLTILMTRHQEIVSKEEILERLWENDNFIDHNTLNVNMTRLRKKIATIGFDRIHTIRGVGYLVK